MSNSPSFEPLDALDLSHIALDVRDVRGGVAILLPRRRWSAWLRAPAVLSYVLVTGLLLWALLARMFAGDRPTTERNWIDAGLTTVFALGVMLTMIRSALAARLLPNVELRAVDGRLTRIERRPLVTRRLTIEVDQLAAITVVRLAYAAAAEPGKPAGTQQPSLFGVARAERGDGSAVELARQFALPYLAALAIRLTEELNARRAGGVSPLSAESDATAEGPQGVAVGLPESVIALAASQPPPLSTIPFDPPQGLAPMHVERREDALVIEVPPSERRERLVGALVMCGVGVAGSFGMATSPLWLGGWLADHLWLPALLALATLGATGITLVTRVAAWREARRRSTLRFEPTQVVVDWADPLGRSHRVLPRADLVTPTLGVSLLLASRVPACRLVVLDVANNEHALLGGLDLFSTAWLIAVTARYLGRE